MSSSQVDAVCLSIPVNHPPMYLTCVCVHVSVIYKYLFCFCSDEWWTFVFFLYFIRNVFAVTFNARSPLCAVSGPAPDELHLPKSKRRHSCLCLCISSLSYLTKTEGHSSTFPLPLAKGHNALNETWKSITPLKDLQTNSFWRENPLLKLFVVPSLISPLFSFDPFHACFITLILFASIYASHRKTRITWSTF